MHTDTQQAIETLLHFPATGIKLGLERVQQALDMLGHPEKNYPCIHVGGSNGKGSVCAMVSSCLSAGGLRVGLYTSPHLSRLNERFRLNQEPVSDELLAQAVVKLLPVFEGKVDLSFFEFGTVLAFWLFAQQKVDAAVIEVGLGGRLDATNVLSPCVSALTSLSMEHTQWLGKRLDDIAFEKAHIFKPGIPALVSAQAHAASPLLAAHAQRIGAPLYLEGRDFSLVPEGRQEGGAPLQSTWQGFGRTLDKLQLSLKGAHQLSNAALALACLELSPFRLDDAALRQGLLQTRWPGRLEYFEGPPPLLLDGAHNPAGIEILVAALKQLWPNKEIHLVFSVFQDKEVEPMAALLFPLCKSIHLAPLDNVRALPTEACLPLAQRFCPNTRVCNSVEEALQQASTHGGEKALVVVAGSLYLVGQARECLQKTPSSIPWRLPVSVGS
ncbi:MAG: bifunctional folylpolyglutamate synthase/dihydrofolate synthase [Cystobacterineae bacterium]|nr:bifunctional folylpolyglutamate synthase/dihydrofolate synthase [Cystobacterineae bacterium]